MRYTRRGFNLYELILVALVISVIVILAVSFYTRLARDVERLSVTVAAHSFITAITGARIQWYIDPERAIKEGVWLQDKLLLPTTSRDEHLEADGKGVRVYLNSEGWPVTTDKDSSARAGQMTTEQCIELWNALLQNPPRATGEHMSGRDIKYRVVWLDNSHCRYRLQDQEPHYFDYVPAGGDVRIYTPDMVDNEG